MKPSMRQESGSALIAAILLTAVMMSIGLATASYVDGQQAQSGGERVRESAFNLAEAALGAQVVQLSRAWPTAASPWPSGATPGPCTSSQPDDPTNGCPGIDSLKESYKTPDYFRCAGATSTDPVWTTWVQDDVLGAERFYDPAVQASRPPYDQNKNGRLWVKATGQAKTTGQGPCKVRTVITAVEQGTRLLTFPKNVVTANWVRTTNNGRKVIIDTRGQGGQSADVVLRCAGIDPAVCKSSAYYQPGQISPAVPKVDQTTPVTASPVGDLADFRAQAEKLNTYYGPGSPAGTCPSSLAGPAVYVEDLTVCPPTSGNANSPAMPGHLYVRQGTLSFAGNTRFYGLVYMGNLQNSPGEIVTLTGNAQIQGAVAIDGPGGLQVGSSKKNLVYDGRVFDDFQGVGTVTTAPNSWRELKPGA